MPKEVTVLCGVSGTGKTHFRTNHLPHVPFVDVADIYAAMPGADWHEVHNALHAAIDKMLLEHERIVVEGYFQAGTRTTAMLRIHLVDLRWCEVTWLHFWAPLDVCIERIQRSALGASKDVRDLADKRIEVLRKCWRPSLPGSIYLMQGDEDWATPNPVKPNHQA